MKKTLEIQKSFYEDTYVKGDFVGQFTGTKDYLKSLFQLGDDYFDLTIDWGELHDVTTISKEQYDVVVTDNLFRQASLSRVKAFPQAITSEFDGFELLLHENKVENVEIKNSTKQSGSKTVGDIRCTLYGIVRKEIVSKDYKNIYEDPEVFFEEFPEENRSDYLIRDTSSAVSFFDGCASVFGGIFGIIALIGLLFFIISIGWLPILILLGIFLIGYLLSRFSDRTTASSTFGCLGNIISGLFSFLFLGLVGWGLLSGLVKSCDSGATGPYVPEPVVAQEEREQQETIVKKDEKLVGTPEQDSLLGSSDSNSRMFDTLVVNKRVWKDYRGNLYVMDIITSKRAERVSRKYRDGLRLRNSFGSIYKDVSVFDEPLLEHIYKSLDSIKTKNNLDKKQFAETIVSMVQDIPYKLVLDGPCEISPTQSNFANDYLKECTENCCIGNIAYGLQTPTEFMQNLYGDCDTRTLTLYTILKHFNYDVGILNSEQFGHSILGISLPYEGQHKIFNNKKYYIWETTQTGLVPGFLASEYNNMKLWEMILTSK